MVGIWVRAPIKQLEILKMSNSFSVLFGLYIGESFVSRLCDTCQLHPCRALTLASYDAYDAQIMDVEAHRSVS